MANQNNKVEEPATPYKLTQKDLIYDINELDFSKQYTYADYLTWRFKERVELIKGWLHKMTPAPRMYHQKVSGNIFGEMWYYLKNQKKCKIYNAPFDVRLTKKSTKNEDIFTVVQPDICVICDKSKLDIRGCIGAPDLIVEILSPSTITKDTKEKYFLYQENGVKEYWIVNPDAQSIEVFLLNKENKYESAGIYNEIDGFTEVPVNLFPGLHLQLKDIFEE